MSALDDRIQSALEALYRIDRAAEVADFRIDRAGLHAALGGPAPHLRESLLVHADDEGTSVALFICDRVLGEAQRFFRRLAQRDPDTARDLDAVCVATEGVSHFVYFTFAGARQDRPVSQVELELQAEIDKYLVLRVLCGLNGAALIPRLYQGFALCDTIGPEAADRYRFANRAARRYARWLHHTLAHGRTAEALDDARALYRKPLAAKLEHIEACGGVPRLRAA